MSEKHKKTWKYLHYVQHLLILASTVTDFVSISVFDSLVCVPVGFTSSSVGLKICATTAGVKNFKSIIKKYDEIVLLGKIKLNTINSYISHDELVSVNNVLREYNDMKEKIINPGTRVEHTI